LTCPGVVGKAAQEVCDAVKEGKRLGPGKCRRKKRGPRGGEFVLCERSLEGKKKPKLPEGRPFYYKKMCHRGNMPWSGFAVIRQHRGTGRKKGRYRKALMAGGIGGLNKKKRYWEAGGGNVIQKNQ